MNTYIFNQTKSEKRGYNVCIELYKVTRNVPVFVTSSHHNKASWKGARGQAGVLLHAIHPRTKFDGYRLTSNSIQLFELGGEQNEVKHND